METVVVDGITTLYSAFIEYGLSEGSEYSPEYGFLDELIRLRESYQGQKFVVTWGKLAHSDRQDLFSQYGRRGANFKSFGLDETIRSLQSSLPFLGIQQFKTDEGEVYDLFSTVTDELEHPVLAYSADRRFLTLVDTDVIVKIPNDRIYDPDVVQQVFGVTPEQMDKYLALFGDQTIGIPGVELRRRAIERLLEDFEDASDLFDTDWRFLGHDERVSLSGFQPQFKLNRILIEPIEVEFESREGEFDEKQAEEYLGSLSGHLESRLEEFESDSGFTKYN